MKVSSYLATAALCAGVFCSPAWTQERGPAVLVTIEPKHGKDVPAVETQDLRVTQNGKTVPVTSVTPAGTTPMQLLLLIDDSANMSLGTEIPTIRKFVEDLPPTVQIGIGYMRNGMTDFTQQFTSDHAAAASTVRLALGSGGADVSPYDSLSDAVKKWPSAPGVERREVLMISSGIEGLGGGLAPENPYVNKAIHDAQRAGVVVYGIYNPAFGHFGHTLWRVTYGQNLMSQLCDETGGESYANLLTAAVDFGPYFQQALDAMSHQYFLSFTPNPVKKAGFEAIRVRVNEKDADVAAPSAVYLRP